MGARTATGIAMMLVLAAANSLSAGPEEIARRNGEQAREALVHSRLAVEAYLGRRDPVTGLLPRNGKEREPKYVVADSGADLFPFLMMASWYTGREVFENQMMEMLRNEVLYSTRVGALSDDLKAQGRGFVAAEPDLDRIIFSSSEYAKDGLLPLTELLGPQVWLHRMRGIVDDIIRHAPYESASGRLPSLSAEVNGEMLQVLSRLAWMTRDLRYIDHAVTIADFYFHEVIPRSNGLPAHKWDPVARKPAVEYFNCDDHGNEIAAGLSEIVLFLKETRHPKYEEFRQPMIDLIRLLLETALNEDGLFRNKIALSANHEVVDARHAHAWGYLFNAVYTTYLITGERPFLDATLRAMESVAAKADVYLDDPAGSGRKYGSNAYSDSLESAIVFVNRLPSPKLFEAIDGCFPRYLARQRPDGIIEDWHGDGNYVRTALMYALMKSQGTWAEPWREDIRLGGAVDGPSVVLTVVADQPWRGRVRFDLPRHRAFFNLPVNYVRLNEWPEWFTVGPERLYRVRAAGQEWIRLGGELMAGLDISTDQDGTVVVVTPLDGPPYAK